MYRVLVCTLPQEFHLSQYVLPFLLTSVTKMRDTMQQRLTTTRIPTSVDCLPENDIFLMATTSPSLLRACHSEL